MEQPVMKRQIKRKKFFVSLGAGFMGVFLLKDAVINSLGKKFINKTESIKIKINPKAVSRNKPGNSNG